MYIDVRANEKSSLFEFKQWIKGAVFMPDKHMSVTVDIVNVNDQFLLRPLKNCSACRAKWEDSNMVEAIRTVHWGSIGTLDLSVIVRILIVQSSILLTHSFFNRTLAWFHWHLQLELLQGTPTRMGKVNPSLWRSCRLYGFTVYARDTAPC